MLPWNRRDATNVGIMVSIDSAATIRSDNAPILDEIRPAISRHEGHATVTIPQACVDGDAIRITCRHTHCSRCVYGVLKCPK